MQKLATIVLIACLFSHANPAFGTNLFCGSERGVRTLQEDPEMQHLLHAWIMMINYTSVYDACGLRNGRDIRRELARRLNQCPPTARQTIVERCVLSLMWDRVESYPGTCAQATQGIGRTEESIRAEGALGLDRFFQELDARPDNLTPVCL